MSHSTYELNTKIKIQVNNQVKVGGNTKDNWTDFAAPWAGIVWVHGNLAFAANMENSVQKGTVTIRYLSCPTLSCSMRAVIGGKAYKITSVDDIRNRHEWLEFKIEGVTAK